MFWDSVGSVEHGLLPPPPKGIIPEIYPDRQTRLVEIGSALTFLVGTRDRFHLTPASRNLAIVVRRFGPLFGR